MPTWGIARAAPQHGSSPRSSMMLLPLRMRHGGFNAAHLVSRARSHGSMSPQNATHKQIPRKAAAQRTMGPPAHLKVSIKPVQERDPMVHITLR